jgi:nucleoside-diphosphate-sugar epimerase
MSVLITGGGLVGSQIARLEQDAGRVPVIYDMSPRPDALADFVDLARCVVVRGDVCSPLDLVAAIRANDVRRIIHTAAFGGLTAGSNLAPLTSTTVNMMGTAYVLEAARVLELDRVVLCSSSTLYPSVAGGEDKGAYGFEEAYPRPVTVYAANKQAAEDLGRAYHRSYGLDVVAVRFASVFGPWGPGGGGVATTAMEGWLRSALAGQPVEVDPFGTDWIYSKDAAKGTHLACWADGLEDRLFNLGMGRVYTAQDVAEAIEAAVPGSSAKASSQPTRAVGAPDRPSMNIDRARSQLGFEVAFPMPVALADYRAWIEAKRPEGS